MCAIDAYLADKKILVLGMGREGKSTLRFLQKHAPTAVIAVADQRDPQIDGIPAFFGADYLSHMAEFDMVIKSPGIPFVGVEIPAKTEITCQTDLFLRFAPCVTVGITGTKGKTTTSTLIHEILEAAEVPNCLIGNIGVPVLDVFDDCAGKIAVMELSCHQLEFMRKSPHVAVFTNLYPEHLDHYDGFAGYAAAKMHISANQTADDFFIYGNVEGLREYLADKEIHAQKIPVDMEKSQSTAFYREISACNNRLIGRHNAQNTVFAAEAAKCLGISEEAIARGIRNFGGIEHRMEPVGTFRGISFVNDSIATAPEVVLMEIEALKNVDTLIFGGLDRGLDYTQFEWALADSGVRNLIGLPETGHSICERMKAFGTAQTLYKAQDMEDAVKTAYRLTESGKTCLFSPAAASYNVYKSFEEKGRHFKTLVTENGKM